jgi:branched-chain amino acid transport system ATP-binding protein
MNPLLELRSVTKRFGGLAAVHEVSFSLAEGETLGIIGPNGAGKTTLLNLISGVTPPTHGHIVFGGDEISGMTPDHISRRGVGRTYQIPQPFQNMTVEANVMLGCLYGRHESVSLPEARDQAGVILTRVGLIDSRYRPARALTLLELKRLELARALSLRPRLILLDEIGAGLTKPELPPLKELIRNLQSSGLAIIIIEHVLELVFDLCPRLLVLDFGKTVVEGAPKEVAQDPRVLEVYLGKQDFATSHPVLGVVEEGLSAATDKAPLLRATGIQVAYGGFQALFDVSLEVWPGEIVALLGANGSGKTTVVRSISSMIRPAQGEIQFRGARTDRMPPDQVVELGIAQCMEGRRIFPELTVLENLEIGAYARRARAQAKDNLAFVFDLFPVLFERRKQQGQTLSGGQQQMLAIGRALMANPILLLLDEVSLGLAPVVIDQLYEAIRQINRRGVAVLLVEQNVHRSLAVAHRGYILERGCIKLAGSARDLAASENLAEHYFGF